MFDESDVAVTGTAEDETVTKEIETARRDPERTTHGPDDDLVFEIFASRCPKAT